MIRMFYYESEDFMKRMIDKEVVMYSESQFEHLLNAHYYYMLDESFRPFRDELSKKLLKDSWDMEFISDDDWYSINYPPLGRICLHDLSKEMKYA